MRFEFRTNLCAQVVRSNAVERADKHLLGRNCRAFRVEYPQDPFPQTERLARAGARLYPEDTGVFRDQRTNLLPFDALEPRRELLLCHKASLSGRLHF
jgi:hypothetical protein